MENDLDFRIEIKEKLAKIEGMLENMAQTNDLKLLALDDKIKVANNRIKDLEENSKWLWRAIAGALISSVIAFLIKIK